MEKKVVLFLTSPNSFSRTKMCLDNFKQLEKLGCDIITLTTTDCLPEYIYEKSKLVIHDYNENRCSKKEYATYYKNTNGLGYFFYDNNSYHNVVFFQDTHFPSLIRNIKTLIGTAKSLSYDKYFYCEDDHLFDDDDLLKLNSFFDDLNHNDLILFTFNSIPNQETSKVYCTYFHFGNLNEECWEIFKNFPYTVNEFTKDPDTNLHFLERTFLNLVTKYKSEKIKISEIKNPTDIFNKSTLNIVYSYNNVDDEFRCNFIYSEINQKFLFYYHTIGLKETVDIKVYVDGNLHNQNLIYPGCWTVIEVDPSLINKTYVVLNNKIIKSFKNLNVNDIVYNGKMFK